MDDMELFTALFPFMNEVDKTEEKLNRVREAIPSLKPRAKTLKDMIIQADYLCAERPLTLEGKTAKPLRKIKLRKQAWPPSQLTENLMSSPL